MNPDGVPIPKTPDPSKEDPKALMEQIARLTRQLTAERQQAAATLAQNLQKCKAEMDKLRQTTYQHVKDVENQRSALLQSLGMLKAENDEFQRKIAILEHRLGNGVRDEVPRVQAEPAATIAVTPSSPTLGGEEIPQLPPRQ
jgi:hypothetical protein